MPRIANETGALLADIQKRLARLVDIARKEGREDALTDVRRLVSGGTSGTTKAGKARKKPGPKPKAKAKSTKRKKKRKNPWATMTPAQKKERVRKMLAGRGLKPKSDR